jgi:hypothetical protein
MLAARQRTEGANAAIVRMVLLPDVFDAGIDHVILFPTSLWMHRQPQQQPLLLVFSCQCSVLRFHFNFLHRDAVLVDFDPVAADGVH